MMSLLVLEGGAEFVGRMAEVDQRALELAGGVHAPVRILPTAAAPDHNHLRASKNGARWFRSLGATDVRSLPLIDRSSAADPYIIAELQAARLIYLLGGFTGSLARTLAGSPAWEAALRAYADGAVLAGSSAGAMVLCELYYDPDEGKTAPGLNLLPGVCVLPHHNTFGQSWATRLAETLAGITLLGIDEQTGLISETDRSWTVLGGGEVTIYQAGEKQIYQHGERLNLV